MAALRPGAGVAAGLDDLRARPGDLARHDAEAVAHLSVRYALSDDAQTALRGCACIDPPERQGADAESPGG